MTWQTSNFSLSLKKILNSELRPQTYLLKVLGQLSIVAIAPVINPRIICIEKDYSDLKFSWKWGYITKNSEAFMVVTVKIGPLGYGIV